MENMAMWYCSFNIIHFTKNYCAEKNEKGLENYTMVELCPAHHIDITARRLYPWTRRQLCFRQHRQSQPITRSLLTLLSFNAKAPNLHTVSVFYQRKLNALREMVKIIVHLAFFGIIDCRLYRGQNYLTYTIIIVHLATLLPLVNLTQARTWGLIHWIFFNEEDLEGINVWEYISAKLYMLELDVN